MSLHLHLAVSHFWQTDNTRTMYRTEPSRQLIKHVVYVSTTIRLNALIEPSVCVCVCARASLRVNRSHINQLPRSLLIVKLGP